MRLYSADITGSLVVSGSLIVTGSTAANPTIINPGGSNSEGKVFVVTGSAAITRDLTIDDDLIVKDESDLEREVRIGYQSGETNYGSNYQLNVTASVNSAYSANFDGDLLITGSLVDKDNATGTAGQVLSSTGTQLSWVANDGAGITGTGTIGTVPKFTASTVLGNSIITEASSTILINKASNPTSLQIGSSLADDPFLVFQTDGNTMSMGIDRGDSNKFKISDNATLGTNDRLTVTTGGTISLNVMSTADVEGYVKMGRSDGNISRYNQIKNKVSGTQASNFMKLSVHNGTENSTTDAITILGTGNVGINASDPIKNLDVRGQLAISNNATSYWYLDRDNSTGNLDFLNYGDAAVKFSLAQNGDGTFANVLTAQSLRTSTSNDGYNLISRGGSGGVCLYVQGNTNSTVLDVRYGSTTAGGGTSALNISGTGIATFTGDIIPKGNTRNISFQGSTTTNTNAQIQYDQLNDNAGQLFFKTANSAALATRLSISTDGVSTFTKQWGANLPILKAGNTVNNIATSTYDTVVIQADDVTSIRIREYNSGGNQEIGLSVGDNNASITSTQNLRFYTGATAGSSIYNGGGGIQALAIAADGFITQDISRSGFAMKIVNTADASQGLQILSADNDEGLYILDCQSSAGGTYSSKFTVSKSGRVGIGGTSPSSKLYMYGNVNGYLTYFYNDGNDANYGGIRLNGGANNGSGTTYYLRCDDGDATEVGGLRNNNGTFQLYDSSDRSLKENIEDTDIKGLDRINALKVRKFNWKKNGILNVAGFVAQEVENIIPEASSPMDSGLLSVSVTSMVPTLVKAIQEQQTIIQDLKSRIETLEG